MFKNILVAVDGSQFSDAAFEVAADLAQKSGARLTVLHVFPGSTGTGTIVSGEAENASGLGGHNMMGSYQEKLAGRNLAGARFVLEKGDAADKILQAANSEAADLIVIGSRGRGALEAMMLGSVSRKVVADAKCKVLVVR